LGLPLKGRGHHSPLGGALRLALAAGCAALYGGLLLLVGRPLVGEGRAAAVALVLTALVLALLAWMVREDR
jgi:hypothetical protein